MLYLGTEEMTGFGEWCVLWTGKFCKNAVRKKIVLMVWCGWSIDWRYVNLRTCYDILGVWIPSERNEDTHSEF